MTQKQKDNVISWIEGLLSGKYTQGYGSLVSQRVNGTVCHCAEGVACEELGVFIKRGSYYIYDCPGSRIYCSTQVNLHVMRAEFGMPADIQAHIIALNDKHQESFHFIAGFLQSWLDHQTITP